MFGMAVKQLNSPVPECPACTPATTLGRCSGSANSWSLVREPAPGTENRARSRLTLPQIGMRRFGFHKLLALHQLLTGMLSDPLAQLIECPRAGFIASVAQG